VTITKKYPRNLLRKDAILAAIGAYRDRFFSWLIPVGAFLLSLAILSIVIAVAKVSPLVAYGALMRGAFGNQHAIATTLIHATVLIFAGLGIAVAFRSGVWNVGAEGQILIGGLTSAVVGIYVKGLPIYVHLPLCLASGFVGGSLWGGLAGFLLAKYRVNEIITTLMMNYIAMYFVGWLIRGPIRDPGGSDVQTFMILPSATLPIIYPGTNLHAGIIVALLTAVLIYVLMFRTSIGYQLRAVGINVHASRYSGMRIHLVQVSAMLISGGLAGLGGAAEILGAQYRLRDYFLSNYGFDAIAVAMLGQLHPIGLVLSGILFGGLKTGAATMQRMTNLPSSLIYLLQGTVVIFVVSATILQTMSARSLSRREERRNERRAPE